MGAFKSFAQRIVNAAWYKVNGKPIRQSKRTYASAQISSITSGWTTTPRPVDVDIRNGLRKLRARARHEAQNNDYVRKFLSLVKANVVGTKGIRMQSRVIDPRGKFDELASAAIEKGWKEWGRKGNADVTGKFSWRIIQRMYIENLARDGEVLIRKLKGWRGNKFKFALQFYDPEVLDAEYNKDLRNGNVIRMGVELNAFRRPVAYHVMVARSTGDDYISNGKRYQRIPADQIIHEFLPEWVWQTRGVPWVSAGLLRLNMLGGYEEAELVASRAGASKFAVYEKTDDEMPTMDPEQQFEQQENGKFVQDFESGTIEVAPEGYRLNLIDPTHPNTAYKDFVKACLRGISAGLGVSYNSLANDLEGVNYSSLRYGALEDRDIWMILQDWMIESLCESVFPDWLSVQLLAGTLTINGKPLKQEREENYQNVVWQPRRWQWVDPQKELTAHQIAFNNKIKSPQSVIRDMGEDPELVLDEWEEWQKELDKRNLKIEPATMAGSSFKENDNDDEEANTQNKE